MIQDKNWVFTTKKEKKIALPFFGGDGERVIPIYACQENIEQVNCIYAFKVIKL